MQHLSPFSNFKLQHEVPWGTVDITTPSPVPSPGGTRPYYSPLSYLENRIFDKNLQTIRMNDSRFSGRLTPQPKILRQLELPRQRLFTPKPPINQTRSLLTTPTPHVQKAAPGAPLRKKRRHPLAAIAQPNFNAPKSPKKIVWSGKPLQAIHKKRRALATIYERSPKKLWSQK